MIYLHFKQHIKNSSSETLKKQSPLHLRTFFYDSFVVRFVAVAHLLRYN